MKKIRAWRVLSARIDEVEVAGRCDCINAADRVRCPQPPRYVVTWNFNRHGLPGLGEQRIDVVCGGHLRHRLRAIYKYTRSATVVPYEEVEPHG